MKPIENAPDIKTACQGMGEPQFNLILNEDGKIDVIRFSKYMAKLNGIDEKESMKQTLDFLGIKYK
jgi:hypothetical protein